MRLNREKNNVPIHKGKKLDFKKWSSMAALSRFVEKRLVFIEMLNFFIHDKPISSN